MTKEQLRNIKNAIKSTILKVIGEPLSINSNKIIIFEKIKIMYDKVYEKCNKNHKLSEELFKLAIEELKVEACDNDLLYMLTKIEEANKK